ncbi:hypothetical protein LguiA_031196 [Lonicera macranthoides]
MGAITNDCKHGHNYYAMNYRFPSSSSPDSDSRNDSHISKKAKYSLSLRPECSSSSKSAASKVSRYPTPVQQIRREVHAPCRAPKFGSFRSNSGGLIRHGGNSAEIESKGKFLFQHYKRAMKSALSMFRYYEIDKAIGVEQETVKDDVSEDSSVEEVVELVEERSEGLPRVLEQRSKETDEILANFKKLDEKDMEHKFLPSSSSGVSEFSNLKIGSVSLNEELDVVRRVPLYIKLLDSAKKSDEKLSNLSLQIKYQESIRSTHLITPAKKREEYSVSEPFVPLSDDEEAEVARAFSSPNRRMILVTHENSNIEITVEKLRCLRPRAWLNDEVINVYLELLKEREKREPLKYLKCHFFSTFFYKKLFSGRNSYDFKSVKRWTTQRKLGYCLRDCDKIFVPIHKEVHWCLAVINNKDKKFQYLDSLKGVDRQVMKVLARYFVDEVKDKSGRDIDVNSWKQEYVQDLPDQENGYDCGMFMIKYADFYSRDIGLCFKQEHMPYFRLRTAKEILRLTAE